ncbi:helix-turn-helix domain-containing protein [Butyrivibrio sp. FC2001]|uniref:helix-turn-helix domain-containing protein n=1 Tax=Butyrivibrio sp. FC2001 TaxID=1280671 RepID=UPI000414CDAD|nr:helix-turn-helix domain-containing protein [Butyrivibrio sp. FC2001]
MLSKLEVIADVKSTIDAVHKSTEHSMTRSIGWINVFDDTANRFIADIEKTKLFEKLEPGWEYETEYSYSGFVLNLNHYNVTLDEDGSPRGAPIDQSFVLVTTTAQYLSTAEYASLYEVGETAVRNWLRRGKLRAAERVGNVWRIPALLTPPKSRGYQSARYSWENELLDLPDEFSYLNEFRSLYIKQDDADKKQFKIYLYCENSLEVTREEAISVSERERLELMLISNPDVHYNARADEGVLADVIYGNEE